MVWGEAKGIFKSRVLTKGMEDEFVAVIQLQRFDKNEYPDHFHIECELSGPGNNNHFNSTLHKS